MAKQAEAGDPQRVGRPEGVKYVQQILDLLRPLHNHAGGPNRELHYDEYVAWILLYFFSPTLTSLRGMQAISDLPHLNRKLGLKRFSLGSFSEAGSVFDPALAAQMMEQVGQRLKDRCDDPRLSQLERAATAVDGTLIEALPRMVWALWLDAQHRAAKLHLHFSLLQGVPQKATVTDAQRSEAAELAEQLLADMLYVLDRGYADYSLLTAIREAGSSFVVRIRDNARYHVLTQRPISEAARRLGVVEDVVADLGCDEQPQNKVRQVRLVRLIVPNQRRLTTGRGRHRPTPVSSKAHCHRIDPPTHEILLATDLLDLDVELIALIFQKRWQIELFFRWFKVILRADHLLSTKPQGLTIVMYCALIASMLVVLWTGRKPNKRAYEALCFYFMGWMDEQELSERLDRYAPPCDKSSH